MGPTVCGSPFNDTLHGDYQVNRLRGFAGDDKFEDRSGTTHASTTLVSTGLIAAPSRWDSLTIPSGTPRVRPKGSGV